MVSAERETNSSAASSALDFSLAEVRERSWERPASPSVPLLTCAAEGTTHATPSATARMPTAIHTFAEHCCFFMGILQRTKLGSNSVQRLDVTFIDLNSYRAHDQIDGDDDAESVLPANQDAFHASHGSIPDTHEPSLLQVGVGLNRKAALRAQTQNPDFVVGHNGRLTVKSHEAGNSRQDQHSKPLRQRNVDEDVARKQHHVEPL